MILDKKSIFYNLPHRLDPKQLLIIDSIRFTCELIDYNYKNIVKSIDTITTSYEISYNKALQINILISSVWAVIDYVGKLVRLYELIPSDDEHKNINNIRYIREYRNTFQHMDERINECLYDKTMPFYGIVSWETDSTEENIMNKYFVFSGLIVDKQAIFMELLKKDYFQGKYNNICFTTMINEGTRKTPNYCKNELNLQELILESKIAISNFEQILTKLFSEKGEPLMDWTSMRDIIIRNKF